MPLAHVAVMMTTTTAMIFLRTPVIMPLLKACPTGPVSGGLVLVRVVVAVVAVGVAVGVGVAAEKVGAELVLAPSAFAPGWMGPSGSF
jgi:hypothetical protein